MISKKISRERKSSDFERCSEYVIDAKQNPEVLWTRVSDYVVDDKLNSDGEKLLWYRISNCYSDVPAMANAEVLSVQAENTRTTQDKTMHLVVSFPEGEFPTRAQMEDIEDEMCKALGYGEFQRVSAVHQDTDNMHLHIAINKIHPVTFNLHEPYRDYYTRDRVCRELEIKHGLTVDNGIGQGQRFGREQERESHGHEETLWKWIQDNAKADLLQTVKTATGWEAFHEKLAENGLMIKPRGAGLVIGTLDGVAHVKASSIDRSLSSKRLTEGFGEYQPPQQPEQTNTSQQTGPQYQKGPRLSDPEAKALYASFQAEKQAVWLARDDFKTRQKTEKEAFNQSLKEWHQSERKRVQVSSLPAAQKRQAYSKLSADRQRHWDDQRKKEASERKVLFEANTSHTWEQFLIKAAERGNSKALELLRLKKQKQARVAKALLTADNYEAARHIVYEHLKPYARKNGDLVYRVQDGGSVTDERTRVRVDEVTAGSAFLALTMAAERFQGQPLDVRGEDAFKQQVVQFAAQYGMAITFKDSGLEAERRRQVQNLQKNQGVEPLSPALEAFITQRNLLKEKVRDVLPHRAWTSADTDDLIYQGRRNLTDGSQAVLLEKDGTMLVRPVGKDELQGLKVGQKLTLDEQGKTPHKTRGHGYER